VIKYLLNEEWTMKKVASDITYKASIPTTMYQVLYENQVIEDPFYGENDLKQRDLSDSDYIFSKTIEIDEALMSCKIIELEFKGLDTLATIEINGTIIGKTNNMHRTYIFNMKPWVQLGPNELVITFDSPTEFIKKEQAKFPLWGISSTMDGYEHLRKAHHMFGWDWGPQLPDMGIWRDVELRGIAEGKLNDFYVVQSHGVDQVDLEVQVSSKNLKEGLEVRGILTDMDGNLISEVIGSNYSEIFGGVKVISVDANEEGDLVSIISMSVKSPKLWWPNGYGEQYLYQLSIELMDGNKVIDVINKKLGLRTMTVTREKDKWGESFDFTINGKRIFAMGADYIPEDTLISRTRYDDTKRLIKDCAKANYNCLRVWGGGVYPHDDLFDLCDEYGLLVWEDFMFACGVYRLTDEFTDNISHEFIDNIKRIRHHACLGLWCGNNEMEWAFVEWGLPKDERLKVDYIQMYEKLIPNILNQYDPQSFYWPASPSSGGGFEDPNGDSKGDVHYWTVFHGNEHYKKFRDHYFRFASEYGMQALPDFKTVKSYTPEDQMNLFSAVSENHNKCTDPLNGNIKIVLNMAGEFKLPGKFEDQTYISQVFQAETIKCAVEHFRRNRGQCMGSTYWQVNDNYPVASWSSIDYYGRWKALHYFARRFYAPVLVSGFEEGSIGHIHITNEQLSQFKGKLAWQLRHVDGRILEHGEEVVTVDELSALHVIDVSIDQYVKNHGDERSIYLSFQLLDSDLEIVSSDNILFTQHKFFEFVDAEVKVSIVNKDSDVWITLESDEFIKSAGIHFKELDIVLSDNFFDLLPGQDVSVKVEEIIGDTPLEDLNLLEQIKVIGVNTIKY